MKIYLSHASAHDFKGELYAPLKASRLVTEHTVIFPHDGSAAVQDSKHAISNSNLVIADVSYPSTGQGIELGWANDSNVPIVCIYKKGMAISGALALITDNFIEYKDSDDMIAQLGNWLITAG